MAERHWQDGLSLPPQVAAQLCARLGGPRYLAQALIREHLGDPGPFLGKGTRECPWIVFDRAGDFYALYLRDRDLIQQVHGRPDEVVCAL